MKRLHRQSVAEQTARHLREGLREGRWRGQLPGVVALAAELGVAKATLRAALRVIEAEGLVAVENGTGRSRRVIHHGATARRALRIGILLYEPLAQENAEMHELLTTLRHALTDAGCDAFFATQTQAGLRHDVARITRHLEQTSADAWIAIAGTKRILEWFAGQPVPCLAFAGRWPSQPLAAVGPDKVPALIEATRGLLGHGHRRIVMVCRRDRRVPEPGPFERAFLDTLKAHAVPVGAFHLPDWEETPEGLQVALTELFRVSPPTALIVEEAPMFFAVQQFLLRRGLRVPGQVSLVATDQDPAFGWCSPPVAHIRWQRGPIIRRIVRWATAVSEGRRNVRQIRYPAEFVPGGTVGPVG